jgi:hypothetical protein
MAEPAAAPPNKKTGSNKRPRPAPTARACDSCKKMKRRCSGTVPCDQCVRRGKAAQCHYSEPRRRGPKKGWTRRLKEAQAAAAAAAAASTAASAAATPTVGPGAAGVQSGVHGAHVFPPSHRHHHRSGSSAGRVPDAAFHSVGPPLDSTVDFRLIDAYFDEVYPLLPVCGRADVQTAVAQVCAQERQPQGGGSTSFPHNAALCGSQRALLDGLQACGCFFYTTGGSDGTGHHHTRLRALIEAAFHGCVQHCVQPLSVQSGTPSPSSMAEAIATTMIRALLVGSWACLYVAEQVRAALLAAAAVELAATYTATTPPRTSATAAAAAGAGRPTIPPALRDCCTIAESWLAASSRPPQPFYPRTLAMVPCQGMPAAAVVGILHSRFLAIVAHLRPCAAAYHRLLCHGKQTAATEAANVAAQRQPTPMQFRQLCAELRALEVQLQGQLGPTATLWRLALSGCAHAMLKDIRAAEADLEALHSHCCAHPANLSFPESLLLVHETIACISAGTPTDYSASPSQPLPPRVSQLVFALTQAMAATNAPLTHWLHLSSKQDQSALPNHTQQTAHAAASTVNAASIFAIEEFAVTFPQVAAGALQGNSRGLGVYSDITMAPNQTVPVPYLDPFGPIDVGVDATQPEHSTNNHTQRAAEVDRAIFACTEAKQQQQQQQQQQQVTTRTAGSVASSGVAAMRAPAAAASLMPNPPTRLLHRMPQSLDFATMVPEPGMVGFDRTITAGSAIGVDSAAPGFGAPLHGDARPAGYSHPQFHYTAAGNGELPHVSFSRDGRSFRGVAHREEGAVSQHGGQGGGIACGGFSLDHAAAAAAAAAATAGGVGVVGAGGVGGSRLLSGDAAALDPDSFLRSAASIDAIEPSSNLVDSFFRSATSIDAYEALRI